MLTNLTDRHIPVLIADDDEHLLRLVATLARSAGVESVCAGSGAAAFSLFMQHEPKLLISDLNMPGGDGFVLIERIRKISKVPVILVTAMSSESVQAMDVQRHDNITVVYKPFDNQKLLRLIEDCLATGSIPLPGGPQGKLFGDADAA